MKQNNLKENRKKEIVDACRKLYETMSFKEITIKEISTATTFSRPSIYNYFNTKEEIFLEIFKEEYDLWNLDLEKLNKESKMSALDFSHELATSIDKRKVLLKLLSMNMYDIEDNSEMDRLIEFKKSYGLSIKLLSDAIENHFDFDADEVSNITYSFLSAMFGIYPYTVVAKRQMEAILQSGYPFNAYTSHELIRNTILRLLGGK